MPAMTPIGVPTQGGQHHHQQRAEDRIGQAHRSSLGGGVIWVKRGQRQAAQAQYARFPTGSRSARTGQTPWPRSDNVSAIDVDALAVRE